MLQYLKNRWAERSTTGGLVATAVGALAFFFPEYSAVIGVVAGSLGIAVAAAPTGGEG